MPRSAHDCWMQRTISAVESNRVPSQSNAIRSKRGRESVIGADSMRLAQHAQQSDAFGRQRRFEVYAFAAGRMIERQAPCVQEHAVEAHAREALAARELAVQREVAVLVVADDCMAFVRQV